ncbi:E3 ubiquitin-protein ligase RNF181-like [Durio zibethinus]|uniref:E3 ubiquitin-protein ligase RNF181-like n=1 Tax=Durio zibethinus TaxID=66656 RepID=A0A6P6BF90_DURZI|nr:E3 ubiquitin-protein ligase RNF181-like [Durio zibethinus]
MLYYVLLILNQLKLAWNLLLKYSMFPNVYDKQEFPQQHLPGVADQQLGVVRYNWKQQKQNCFDDDDEEEEVACAVCLCRIEEDDEMRELRCNHLFHKVCLDRWLGYSLSMTCPICRTFLSPAKLVAGVEVLIFNYCTFNSNHHDNWWLR